MNLKNSKRLLCRIEAEIAAGTPPKARYGENEVNQLVLEARRHQSRENLAQHLRRRIAELEAR